MESNKLIAGIVAAAIAIIVLAGVLMPALSNATATTDKFTNDGYFHMTKYGTDTDLTISWDHTKPRVLTVNDNDYSLSGFPTNQFISLVIGDDWFLRFADGGANLFLQCGTVTALAASTQAGSDMVLECSNGSATATTYTSGTPGSTKSLTYTELYVCSGTSGDYVMKKSDVSAYMNGDSEFVALGTTSISPGVVVCRIDGTIDDGADVEIVDQTSGLGATIKADSEVINKTDLSSNKGYELSTIQFAVTVSGVDTTVTYSYFIVPAEVTIEKAQHLSDAQIVILDVIPLLIIVSVLLGVVAVFILRRE